MFQTWLCSWSRCASYILRRFRTFSAFCLIAVLPRPSRILESLDRRDCSSALMDASFTSIEEIRVSMLPMALVRVALGGLGALEPKRRFIFAVGWIASV